MRIDIHAHYFPETYLDLLQSFGSEATNIARHMGAGSSSVELEARLELMDSAQVQMQVRANDLPYEIGFRLGASRTESKMWQRVLTNIGTYYGVTEPVQAELVCIDPRVQWSQFWNIWQNAAIRTFLYKMLAPARWTMKRVSH